jgi:hypothetical protein
MIQDGIPDYWNDWKLDPEEFNRIIHQNSNALSAIYGYVAEERLREEYGRANSASGASTQQGFI